MSLWMGRCAGRRGWENRACGLCSQIQMFKSRNFGFTSGCKVSLLSEVRQGLSKSSSQNAYEKLQWRNVSVLADVVPLGLVKPDPCLSTAPSSECLLGGDTSGTGVRSCRCLRFSGELGAGGTCSSLHPRCPELQKEPPAEECYGSELCSSMKGPVGCLPVAFRRVPGHHRNGPS